MTHKWLFDVDGTLTPSRQTIDPEFEKFFIQFATDNDVYLVTGSDRPKTLEQVGKQIYDLCARVYNCSGSEVWEQDTLIRGSDWTLPEHMETWLNQQLTDSEFELRTGLHFEHRCGMVNFSVVGRNADSQQRKQYYTWDCINKEREHISEQFNQMFGDTVIAKVGGETGLDIFPTGCDKAQIITDFDTDDNLHFFGDRCDQNGNDYTLSLKVLDRSGRVYPVADWHATYNYLNMSNVEA